VTITGDTRFDRVLQIKEQAKQLPIIEQFTKGQKVFIAGSSWQPDEEIFIKYFSEHRDWKMVIAPHVIGEDHLQQIEKLLEGRKVVRYSDVSENSKALEDA
jgi:3-deoxy-D-manno-octulosonic-acid transferase